MALCLINDLLCVVSTNEQILSGGDPESGVSRFILAPVTVFDFNQYPGKHEILLYGSDEESR